MLENFVYINNLRVTQSSTLTTETGYADKCNRAVLAYYWKGRARTAYCFLLNSA